MNEQGDGATIDLQAERERIAHEHLLWSMGEANRILREAGWRPLATWAGPFGTFPNIAGDFAFYNLVGGHPPGDASACHVKDWAKIAPGHPAYSASTPDEPHEAAAWLIQQTKPRPRWRRRMQPEAAAQAPANDTAAEAPPVAIETPQPGGLGAGAFGAGDFAGEPEAHPIDAQAATPEASNVNADFGILPPLDAEFSEASPAVDLSPADLSSLHRIGAEQAEEEAPTGGEQGARFYMGDNLDTMRRERIGAVVELSHAKQAAIWAASGTTEDAYQDLVSAVMRDTINGVYTGPATRFQQFTALQSWANSAASVRRLERERVAFLTHALRPELETFDPAAGWPDGTQANG